MLLFFAIIIAGLSQLTIPLGLIPLTGQTFAVGLAVTFLGMRTGTMSILIYLLLGLIGLPVLPAEQVASASYSDLQAAI